ncbi:hypothetical protein [Salinicoccus roseus]|uniref:hypothetical protein n=1 Tax=Salinicoccus roseus TaxID=45670 RepID=UPI000F4F93BB|nr:hypothetical protein [Salinicoccus roseus]RPE54242.1 hypothetical protein EDC33_0496 [Salinicoccus roseus]GGA67053.1 hypothetical protein GCM10007176_09400 [Salinicoccus roseus]
MSKKAFHVYNIIILLLLLSFNLLVLLAYGIGEGGMGVSQLVPIALSFVIWSVFYLIQFARSNKTWRISWFLVMLVFLYFWQTGVGSAFDRLIG